MEKINDPKNPIYINGLNRTKDLEDKIKKTRIFSLNSEVCISGPLEDILFHLKGGPAKNLINSFIKYDENKCDYCGIEKSNLIQLDRAHCNSEQCDRASLLRISINKYYVNTETPIKIKDILKTFIILHEKIPIFILCKKCHRNYDKT